ncbi:glycosyltransferase [Nocardioides sp.]|uniref:glycosyltransferase n=1 Tax=Nocardioides sp. TaxID=35761 RepID=UPI0027279992|nr:glycosyltransferase [Nocardioides sp.]MDO9456063.1 glycosyltransferase [Nocardioides sp.]
MRVLVTFAGGRGHLLPMLPLSRALRDAGHELALSGHPHAVGSHGVFGDLFPHERIGPGPDPDGGTGTLTAPDLQHELEVVGRWYAGTLAQRNLLRTREVVERWRPDLVVCDEMDLGSVAAAARAGLPCVVVDVIASGALVRSPYVDDGLAALDLQQVKGDLEIYPAPPSFRDPGFPLSPGAVAVRPEPVGGGDEVHPGVAWLRSHDGPSVYLTLGTIFNTESGDLFSRALGALADQPVRVLATVGSDVDPALVGVRADNVRIERFVPQDQVLPLVDVVVNHGGSGSVIGALAHGLPVVTLAMGADQELNAARLVALDAGVGLDVVTAGADDVRRAVTRALTDVDLRAGATRVRDEVAALPPVSSVVPTIESLVG